MYQDIMQILRKQEGYLKHLGNLFSFKENDIQTHLGTFKTCRGHENDKANIETK